MKNFKFSEFLTALAITGILVTGISCQDKQSEPDPVTALSPDLKVSRIEELAQRAIQKATQQELAAIDKEYKVLSFDELEVFNKEIAALTLEKQMSELTNSNGRISSEMTKTLVSDTENNEVYRTAINKLALKLYGVSYNKLGFDKLDSILSQVAAPDQSGGAAERVLAACTTASFPNVTTKMDNAAINHSSWTRRATPSAPNDCDYEFVYSGTRTKISADNYLSQLLCSYWNYRIARRVIVFGSRPGDSETRLLFGNNGIALYTGTSGFDVNMN